MAASKSPQLRLLHIRDEIDGMAHSEAPWNAIIGIGNILRHEYQRVDDRRLWEIVTVHLPELRPVIMAMIDELKG